MSRKEPLIYLDHAATTPVDPKVVAKMLPFLKGDFGNASSLYKLGKEANSSLQRARGEVASVLNCSPQEIIFTSGGTESANMAIFGLCQAVLRNTGKRGHIITTAIEHHAVLHPVESLARQGWDTSLASVDQAGLVKIETLEKLVQDDTVLISVMYANNEIGTIEPIAEIGYWLHGLNKGRAKKNLPKIYFHTDACQAANELDLDVAKLQVDMLTLNGSKIYGPKGIGILFLKNGTPMQAIIQGGDQERGYRAGTENLAGIVGFAEALRLVTVKKQKGLKHLQELQQYLVDRLSKKVKGIKINGPDIKVGKQKQSQDKSKVVAPRARLFNNINLSIDGVEGESLMLYLDADNIAVSTGSACNAQSEDPSHVLLATGLPIEKVYSSIRITLGHGNTKSQLDKLIDALAKYIPMLRGVTKQV